MKLYDSLYPKELEPADTPALSAMVEGIMRNPGTKDEQTQIGIPDCLFSDRVLDVSDRRLHLRI